MRLDELVGCLPAETVTEISSALPETPVYSVSFLTGDTMAPRGDVLYFGDVTVLPHNISGDSLFSCVVFGTGPLPETLLSTNNTNMVRLSPDADPFACFNALQDRCVLDQAQTAIVSRMLQAFFSEEGLQEFVEDAGEALGNPLLVCDPSYRYIARHIGRLSDDTSHFAKVIRQEVDFQSILEGGVSYIKDHHLEDTLSDGRPHRHYNEFLQRQTLIGAVVVHGIHVAHAILVEDGHVLDEVDERCFSQFLSFVGQELERTPLSEANRGQVNSSFLVNLLEEEEPSQAIISHRMRTLDFELLDTFYMAVIRSRSMSMTARKAELVAARLESILPHNIFALYDGELVFLFNRHHGMGLGVYTETILKNAVSENGLLCGISNAFTDLTEIRRFYDQATNAIDYGCRYTKYADHSGCFHFADYCYIEMFDVCSTKKDLMNYCQPRLLALMDYDELHHGELMQTLFAFLQTAGNTAQAAQILSVHKNTLLYRLGRIREILGDDLDSGEDRFMYHLSFRMLIYLGLFSPSKDLSSADVRHKNDRKHD